MSKRGQVTIFIIIAILIVIAIAIFFLLRSNLSPNIFENPSENPRAFLHTCLQNKIYETADILEKQGGYITPPNLSFNFMFEEEKERRDISYLCYTINYYEPCINQRPMLISKLNEEIKKEISESVNNCFKELEASYEDAGYEVQVIAPQDYFDVELSKEGITLDARKQIKFTKGESTNIEDNFKINFPTKLYDIALVTQEIIAQEARFCNFNLAGYSLLYPHLEIEGYTYIDSVKIYTIKHKETGEWFRFAIRGCARPPGYG